MVWQLFLEMENFEFKPVVNLEKNKLCQNYSCFSHAIWVVPLQPNQVIGPVRDNQENTKVVLWIVQFLFDRV